MKFSALSALALVSSACAQTITVESVNPEQASSIISALSSYESGLSSASSSIGDLVFSATDFDYITAETPFSDFNAIYVDLLDPTDYASFTSELNSIITTSVNADGALQTYGEFVQSVAAAEASIVNSVNAAPGLSVSMGLWAAALIATGFAIALM